jgi:hypothetical protein
MSPTDQNKIDESPEKRLSTMRVLWAAFIINVVVLAFIAYMAAPPADDGAALAGGGIPTVLVILFGLGLLSIALSFLLKGWMMRRAHERQSPQLVQSALILGFACCEAAALFGLVALFVSGNRYSFLLFAVGVAGLLAHFPRREEVFLAPYKTIG